MSVLCSVALAATLVQVQPAATVRFPGANYSALALRDGLVVTCSHWSREDTSGVFDVSDPAKPKFLARFPAKGYSCARPVFHGKFCYVPNGFCASVIDMGDRANPKLAGYLNPHFPQNGCTHVWTEDGDLFFQADDGCYRVKEDGLSFEKVEKSAPKRQGARSATEGTLTVELKDSVLSTGAADIPFAHDLSTLAVKDGMAYVYAPWNGGKDAHLLTLSTKKGGLTLFDGRCRMATLPPARIFQTMGMQTAGCVTRVGDLLFVDDGIVRRSRKGAWEILLERTHPVANASVDGTRIALAQCSRCRVLDFSDSADVKIRDVAPATDLPLHITGCHLRGDELFIAYTLVEFKGQNYIYKFPTKGYVASIDLRTPDRVRSTVEIPPCVALDRVGDVLYVSCRQGAFAVVDASDRDKLQVRDIRRDILDGDGYKVKTFGGRTFALNGRRVVELDTSVPAAPQVKFLYARGNGTSAPSYDDMTVDGNRLYALAHASMDVFELDGATRRTEVRNDCGVNGVMKDWPKEADAEVFADHAANPKQPVGVEFQAGRFGNCFGAHVFDWAKLPDGRYAVAYGEAGLVFCDGRGEFASEPLRGTDGCASVFAAEVVCREGHVYVKDGEGKVWQY